MDDRGFSLVEVLVALFVVSLMAASGAGIIHGALTSREAMEGKAAEIIRMETAHATIRDDVAQWVPRDSVSRPGIDRVAAFSGGGVSGSDLLMAFVRDGWTNPAYADDRSGLIAVRYSYENDAIVRRVRLAPDGTQQTDSIETVLLDDLASVEIMFRDQRNISTRQWQVTTREAGSEPPAVVELRIEQKDGTRLEWLFMTPVVF